MVVRPTKADPANQTMALKKRPPLIALHSVFQHPARTTKAHGKRFASPFIIAGESHVMSEDPICILETRMLSP